MSKTTAKRDHAEPLSVILEAYPGGLSQLAEDADLSYEVLSKFKRLQHSKEPHDILRALADLDWSWVPFAPTGARGKNRSERNANYLAWLELWRAEKRAKDSA